jgi:16S rRNA (guanine(966)-N(2))-methyltransferase RsmD
MSLRIHGNRQLKTLPGRATRPTPARVREAVFNIWQRTLLGCRWLDLCAGSGAMGAEALCRGAKTVIGIEQSGRACAVIQHNWQRIATHDQSIEVIRGNILHCLPQLARQEFDHIYFDPPYASDLYQPVLEAIAHLKLLAPQGELAAEHSPDHAMPERVDSIDPGQSIQVSREKRYGGTVISFYSWFD